MDLKTLLYAMPGAYAEPSWSSCGERLALVYKVMGDTFAVVSAREPGSVVLNVGPDLVGALRGRYAGVGQPLEFDERFWIEVEIESDVPTGEIARLAAASYERVRGALTKEQEVELAAICRGD